MWQMSAEVRDGGGGDDDALQAYVANAGVGSMMESLHPMES